MGRAPRRGHDEEAQSALKRAMDLAGSVSEQERLFIEGTYYGTIASDAEKTCGIFKTLAELFPDDYWAAGNAAWVCGMRLGRREEFIRYVVQAAEQRPVWDTLAAVTLSLMAEDFDRARPYIGRDKGRDAEKYDLVGVRWIAFKEFFLAEEYFDKGMLADVVNELQRVEELLLGTVDATSREQLTWKLVYFYLALGQFQKAEVLGRASWKLLPSWRAFLEGDQTAFQQHLEDFRTDLAQQLPDPDTALAMASPAVNPFSSFHSTWLSWPKLEAELQKALIFADTGHPILVQIRERREVLLETK